MKGGKSFGRATAGCKTLPDLIPKTSVILILYSDIDKNFNVVRSHLTERQIPDDHLTTQIVSG